MQPAFRGKGTNPVLHCPLHIGSGFVHTGETNLVHIRSGLFADGQLAGAAHFDLVEDRGQAAQQEGICLNRKAKTDFFPKGFPNQLDTLTEQI